jgi:hypothetical protein
MSFGTRPLFAFFSSSFASITIEVDVHSLSLSLSDSDSSSRPFVALKAFLIIRPNTHYISRSRSLASFHAAIVARAKVDTSFRLLL